MAKPTERKKRQPISKKLTKRKAGRPKKPVVPIIPPGLTAKESRFVEEYCVDLNATQAAIRAGYSKKSAESIGCENLSKQKISAAVADWKRRLAERLDLTREDLVRRLLPLTNSNIFDYARVTESGDPFPDFSSVTREQAAAVSELETHDYVDGRGEDARSVRKVRFKLYDKPGAVMNAAKLLGLVEDKVKQSGEITIKTQRDEIEAQTNAMDHETVKAAAAITKKHIENCEAELKALLAGGKA